MSVPHILTEQSEGVLTITLNRPEKLNAFTGRMAQEVSDALDRADADDAVRVVIVAGAGRGFCAGADISGGEGLSAEAGMKREGLKGGIGQRIFESRKPIVGAIHGAAVGVGVTMTLPMDIRIAADTAKFGFVFTARGLVPEAGSAWFLPRIVGLPKALEWVYMARTVGADEALAAGLVNEVVAPDALMARAREVALHIARNTAPVATVLTRALMWRTSAADHPGAALDIDSALNLELAKSGDMKAGFVAFREKRLPEFPGRVSADLPKLYPWW